MDSHTRQELERITDAGLFEALATDVLRMQDPRCRDLLHVGVNTEGRTVKSPSDAIAYISGEDSRRMVAVHHTTCRRQDLRSKWLTGGNSDIQKTLRVFQEQRSQIPELRATLIVTTNREPPEDLIHEVQAEGYRAGLDVEIYTNSRIAHFLDTEPRGQWLRQKYLNVSQTQLSVELMRELSAKSIEVELPGADSWVMRSIDEELAGHSLGHVSFIVGESGMGKTVACLKCLDAHIRDGGFGLLVEAEVLGESRTLADAIDGTLRKLHPSLAVGEGRVAVSLASKTTPFLVVVEDVNLSASPAGLLEKLSNWGKAAQSGEDPVPWRVLCPVWPRTMALLSDEAHGWVSHSSIRLSAFSEEEGIAAVQRHRAEPLPMLDATAVATALGNDPLLIALHEDGDTNPQPTAVIRSFVDRSLGKLAAGDGKHTAGEYRLTLRSLSLELLEEKQLEPVFTDVVDWMGDQPGAVERLREIVGSREVARLEGPVERERIVFRHDRVRDHVLADAVEHAFRESELNPSVLSDPYFAEVIGIALAGNETTKTTIDQVAEANPLALFSAMRHFSETPTGAQRRVIDASTGWAHSCGPRDTRNAFLRQAVQRVLAECEGPHVRPLSERIDDDGTDWWALRARFRNRDVSAGIWLCGRFEPGVRVVGHVELIEHVLGKAGTEVLRTLNTVLKKGDLSATERRGALRLAGFTGSQHLSEALQESWRIEGERQELLSDYLWACSQCCGEVPAELLGPILDEWAAMPEKGDNDHEYPRASFGADEIRWAFRDRVPDRAIGYFLKRALTPELRWPLLVMLNGIDNPDAVEFIVKELARADSWSFAKMVEDEWRRRPRHGGEPMKTESRQRLRELWSNDRNARHLRRRALQIWSATIVKGDVAVLKTVEACREIGDISLFQRLRRGDETATRHLLERLEGDKFIYWWQAAKYLWSDELTEYLDRTMARIADNATKSERDPYNNLDWILSERLMELPTTTAERLIEKHWTGLSNLACYVQAALYVASPGLLSNVREVVEHCEDPKSLFQHLASRFGVKAVGRRGITRLSQMEALLPYLDYLANWDVVSFWEVCNENGWFDWRREHLDIRIKRTDGRFDGASGMKKLDDQLQRQGPSFWVHHWGEEVLNTGVSLDQMMELVKDWLELNNEEKALHMAVDLVTRFGRRRHLAVLQSHKSAQSERGQAIIENASFELRLRSFD